MRGLALLCAALAAMLMLSTALSANETPPSNAPPISDATPDDFGADSMLEPLPDEIRSLLPDGDIFDAEKSVELFGYEYFAKLLLELISSALSPALRTFATLLGLLVIASALGNLRSGDGTGKIFALVSAICLMLTLCRITLERLTKVRAYLALLGQLMNAMIPVLTAVAVAGGNLSTAVVSSNAMLIALSAIEALAAGVLLPLTELCFGLSAASVFSAKMRLAAISRLIRTLFNQSIGFISAAISALMSFQTLIASRADSLAMRAARFAATTAIPVAGGIAGEAVRTVAGSLSLVRSGVGWVGVVLILVLTLPELIGLLLTRFGILCASTAADLLGLDSERAMIDEICGLFGSLIAVEVISALTFIYSLAFFALGSTAG